MVPPKARRITRFLGLWILMAGVFTYSGYSQTSPTTSQAIAGFSSQTTPSATSATPRVVQPAPYQKDEFPRWALDLRRSEIVAFGVLPFTIFFTSFAVDSYRFADHSWDFRYAPWPLKSAGAVLMDQNQMVGVFVTGVLGAAVIALADYWIHGSKLRAQKQKDESQAGANFLITREPLVLPPTELPPLAPPYKGP
jgi:hypothetical protein